MLCCWPCCAKALVLAAFLSALRCWPWPRPVARSDPVFGSAGSGFGRSLSLPRPFESLSVRTHTNVCPEPEPAERATAILRRYHKQLCRRAVCPHGTICGRPHCPRAKMFYDRGTTQLALKFRETWAYFGHAFIFWPHLRDILTAAFITAGSNITAHEAFPGNALPWPPYLGRGAWRTRVAGTQNALVSHSQTSRPTPFQLDKTAKDFD